MKDLKDLCHECESNLIEYGHCTPCVNCLKIIESDAEYRKKEEYFNSMPERCLL